MLPTSSFSYPPGGLLYGSIHMSESEVSLGVTVHVEVISALKYSCDHDRRAAIDPSLAIALAPGVSQAAIAVNNSGDRR